MGAWDEDRDFHEAEPAWALKPTEKVCGSCWLVHPCDCVEVP